MNPFRFPTLYKAREAEAGSQSKCLPAATSKSVATLKLLTRAGDNARLGPPIHPHMLRHSTGFKLANDGQDTRAIQHYLGHKNIQHTVLYTQLAPSRFNDFWRD